MRQAYEEELKQLNISFFRMGRLVNEAIHKSVQAFVNHDKELAKIVIEEDEKINQIEHDLEQSCIELIALQQPVTTDLRKVITVMKACADLERMGDHAVSIAKSTIRVKGNKRVYEIEELISQMAERVKEMVHSVLDAYTVDDVEQAKAVAEADKKVDQMRRDIHAECIEWIKQDSEVVVGSTDYMLVSTYIERIGDYVTNISEWILYLKTGEIVELNTHHHYPEEN
nr:phosphate signaling complex protein PhoU [Atopococcus tabaci]